MRRKAEESQPTSLNKTAAALFTVSFRLFSSVSGGASLFPFYCGGCAASGRLKVRCCGKDGGGKVARHSAL